MSYRCAAGVIQETDEPCPRCGATEDSDNGCEGSPIRAELRAELEQQEREVARASVLSVQNQPTNY